MSLQNKYESYLMHYGVPGMKWGQRKEYEAHPRKFSRQENKQQKAILKAEKRERRKKRIKKAGIILGASAATIIGAITISNVIKKKNRRDFKNLEEKLRTMQASSEMDSFIKSIPKAKTNDIYFQQNKVIQSVLDKKISDIKKDVSSMQYDSKRLKELRSWNKNRESAMKFLRSRGIA